MCKCCYTQICKFYKHVGARQGCTAHSVLAQHLRRLHAWRKFRSRALAASTSCTAVAAIKPRRDATPPSTPTATALRASLARSLSATWCRTAAAASRQSAGTACSYGAPTARGSALKLRWPSVSSDIHTDLAVLVFSHACTRIPNKTFVASSS